MNRPTRQIASCFFLLIIGTNGLFEFGAAAAVPALFYSKSSAANAKQVSAHLHSLEESALAELPPCHRAMMQREAEPKCPDCGSVCTMGRSCDCMNHSAGSPGNLVFSAPGCGHDSTKGALAQFPPSIGYIFDCPGELLAETPLWTLKRLALEANVIHGLNLTPPTPPPKSLQS